ncbi:MAG: SDR family NAD(P)-dependent oxidoreductase, partial [Myxococcota bacterium]
GASAARDGAALRAKLDAARDGRVGGGVWLSGDDAAEPGKVAWLFPGQGSQRPGMLADLFVAFPELGAQVGDGWAGRLFPGDVYTPADRKAQRAALTDTRVAQPALGIVELAAAAVLAKAGLAPDQLAGHSYGELVALCVAGALEPSELIALSEARGDAILAGAAGEPGTMAAVAADRDAVAAHLQGLPVVIANENSPIQTVIAGLAADVDAAVARLEGAGLEVRRFAVGAAFHSPVVAGAEHTLRDALGGFTVRAPARTVFANTTAAPYPADATADAVRDQLARHVVSPVRFRAELEAMWAAGARVFVEVGPGRVLTDLVRQTLGHRDPSVTAVAFDDGRGGTAIDGLVGILAELAIAGVPVDLAAILAPRSRTAIDLDAPPPGLPATAWWVDGQRAWPVKGELPDGAMRVVREPLAVSVGGVRERVVMDYLRTLREQADAQRAVMLSFLGTAPAGFDAATDLPGAATDAPVPSINAPHPTQDGPVDPGALLLRIVSERTGYPQEMLDLDLDLEADLSIDSIKRVEILGVLADALGAGGDRPDQDQLVEELAGVKTLRGILDWLAERRGAAAAGDPAASTVTLDDEPTPTAVGVPRAMRFVPELAPLPLPAPTGGATPPRIGVTGVGPHVEALIDALGARGAVVSRVPSGGADRGLAEIDVVIAVTAIAEANGSTGERLYELADELRGAVSAGLGQIAVVTWQGGSLGEVLDAAAPGFGAGVSGLLKTAAKEWPTARIRRIDVDPLAAPDTLAGHLLAEVADREGPTEVGYRDGQRIGRKFALRALDAGPALVLDADAVVLLTGGARGITAHFARAIARRYRCNLVVIGRSPAPVGEEDPSTAGATTDAELRATVIASGVRAPADVERRVRKIVAEREMRDTFAAIRTAGARVEYHTTDVRDASAVRELLDQVYARYGRLDLVLHGAGVNEDKLLRDKTRESFLRVFDTKVRGAHNLAQALREDTRAVVFFSSVAGAFGNRGQADYAAANDALDQLARGLDATSRARFVSIGWGPWGGGGMVTPELEKQYSKRGIGMIDPDDGVQHLLDELAHGTSPHLVVMAAHPQQLS